MARPQTDIEGGREALIDLVIELIEERGSTNLTVTELAARAKMSPASLYRYFESKETLIEAVAERWFQPKVAIMEEVTASDLNPRRKMFEFFARRFALMKAEWDRDPVAFSSYVELGKENYELVRSYVDLGDHYLAEIIGEAMAEGHFAGLSIDEALSLVNQMVNVYVNIGAMEQMMHRLTTDKLAMIVDAMFDGLSATDRGAKAVKGLRAA
ncbi:MAG: TetR family transcriptional regulator [Novosphingobium sp.]|uniref:TetR/AcrR family transcriptional regulator n=1 Tax=Novosphingobium sp. TaxID=1874826 RepID=UPI001DECDA85|nr:TetR family transcriptional regulator [Novosphingobium sp.]MCB2057409.1 TetR family transcriptional regulator [Novosphingobium sp.]MCP5387403.1 TetR family transcriptional regulator [Novosphingobium sp.]